MESQALTHDMPLYTIGVVSEILKVHPETIRIWERCGIIQPSRRNGRRLYSETDLKRLYFIQRLITQGLNIPAICHYLQLYSCWRTNNCPSCMHIVRSKCAGCTKPCWKEEGAYCKVSANEDACSKCKFRKQSAVSQA